MSRQDAEIRLETLYDMQFIHDLKEGDWDDWDWEYDQKIQEEINKCLKVINVWR